MLGWRDIRGLEMPVDISATCQEVSRGSGSYLPLRALQLVPVIGPRVDGEAHSPLPWVLKPGIICNVGRWFLQEAAR